jgi:predicted ATPase/class 3 adenylate cyclase
MSEREQLEQAIAALEAQRAILGDAVVDAALDSMQKQLAALEQAEREAAPELRGERKLVTVMFADISGFTALSETLDPEAVRDMMNGCFEALVPIVEKYDGTVDKFIGDEIMALFGAPTAHEDDPIRALHAALEMMDTLITFNTQHATDLGLHFGINTGLVIAGDLGTQERREYSVMGDAVNLAARLEGASERGEILVGPDTYRLTAPQFEFEALEPMVFKGKAKPVPVYQLLKAKPGYHKVRGIEGLSSPLVGREAEFQVLQDAVTRLQQGVGGIVTLVGEAGLGKSRLVVELHHTLAPPPETGAMSSEIRWIEGRCLSYSGSIAYLLWLDVLRSLLNVTPDDAPLEAQEKLHKRVQALCPKYINDVYPFLAQLLSLPLDNTAQSRLRGIEVEGLHTLTFRAIATLIEHTAQQQPLVIACEDLHWADPTSIDLLERLLALTDRVPLLFLCTLRPETDHPCWRIKETAARRYRHRYTELWLDPLTVKETVTLVSNLLRVTDLSPTLRERILNHAEGNPFYVEELIRSLIDSGALMQAPDGHWEATQEVDDIAIPDTLHGVLTARLDRLQQETKHILQLAAVIGRTFLYQVLADIVQQEQGLETHILTLQRETLIRERARKPDLEYMFKHHLTQETAYNSILHKERRIYHRQVAQALERLFPEPTDELLGLRDIAGQVAWHFEEAGVNDKARHYLQLAGEQALARAANAEAADYISRALALTPETDQAARYAMLLTRERAYDVQAARTAQAQDLDALEKLAQALGDAQKQAEVALRQAAFAEATSDYPTAIAAAQRAITWAEAAQDPGRQATGHVRWAWTLQAQGNYAASRQHLDQALILAKQAERPDLEVQCLHNVGIICRRLGEGDNAKAYFEQALSAYRQLEDWRGESAALHMLGTVAFLYEGNYVGALAHFEEAVHIRREIGDRRSEISTLNNLGVLHAMLGNYAKARAHYQQCLEIGRDMNDQAAELRALINLSEAACQLGDCSQAHDFGQHAVELAQEIGNRSLYATALTNLGHALVGLPQWTEATAAYQQAMDIRNALGEEHMAMESRAGLARVAMLQGNGARAQEHVAAILAYLDNGGSMDGMENPFQVYLTCYQVLLASSEPRARQILEQAFDELQTRIDKINPASRRPFLENVPAHHELVQVYAQAQGLTASALVESLAP